jgi:uncharacterized protein YecE (DUF72 family)
MVKLTISTAGWDYKDWFGLFYPKKLEKSKQLEYYSKFFKIVELNSTFYNLPSENMVSNWKNRVSNDFRFIIKIWQDISHKMDDDDLDANTIEFFARLSLLKPKIEGFLLQLPPWFKYSESHLVKLKVLINKFPPEYKYIIELRDNSWFDIKILSKFIDREKVILCTTYMPNLIPFYLQLQKFYYIRLIGDRELTKFNRIQRDQKDSLSHLYKNILDLKEAPNVYEIFIIVNNHFQGAAPESVNQLNKKFGLETRSFSSQKQLTDFS